MLLFFVPAALLMAAVAPGRSDLSLQVITETDTPRTTVVNVALNNSGNIPIAALQWRFEHGPDLEFQSALVSGQGAAAGKQASCRAFHLEEVCLLWGDNQREIKDGVIAQVTFAKRPQKAKTQNFSLQAKLVAAAGRDGSQLLFVRRPEPKMTHTERTAFDLNWGRRFLKRHFRSRRHLQRALLFTAVLGLTSLLLIWHSLRRRSNS